MTNKGQGQMTNCTKRDNHIQSTTQIYLYIYNKNIQCYNLTTQISMRYVVWMLYMNECMSVYVSLHEPISAMYIQRTEAKAMKNSTKIEASVK